MKNEIQKLDALNVLEGSRAEQIRNTFAPMADMLEGFETQYNTLINESKNGITKELISQAKRLRLDIAKVRIGTKKIKDKQKEYIKLEDKAIMGVHNILVWAVKEKEDKLKEIEKYFELQEQERIRLLQADRAERLSLYVDDAHERDLAKFAEDEFEALLAMKKKQHDDRLAAEKKAEEDRIAKEKAEAEERKRIEEENKRLRKAAEQLEKAAKIEAQKRQKEEEERRAKEEAERKEREKEAAKLQAQLEAERQAKAKIEREERAKREKLEAELKAKEEAERKAKEEAEAKLQAQLNKGDAAKVQDLINDLQALKHKYSFKSAKNTKMQAGVNALLDKVVNYINTNN